MPVGTRWAGTEQGSTLPGHHPCRPDLVGTGVFLA